MDEARVSAGDWLATESETPEVIVVGLPWSPDSVGVAMSPLAVRERLGRFSTFDSELEIDFADLQPRDAGNWPVAGLQFAELEKYLASRLDELPPGGLSIFIGGDDAIAAAIVGSTGAGIIRFTSRSSNTSLEERMVTIGAHGFAYRPPGRDTSERATTITHAQISEGGMGAMIASALAILARSETIHVSVDLDALDPAFVPASPDSRPGGLDVRRLAEGVRLCAASAKVTSMDFVGADTHMDGSDRTLDVSCHLMLSALIGLKERSPGG